MKKLYYTFVCSSLLLSTSVLADQVLNAVSITGTNRIEDATIMNYLNWQKGKVLSSSDLDEAVKTLFDTGLFSEVKVTMNQGIARVQVQENPIVNELFFEGNRKLEDTMLRPEISLKPRAVWTKAKMQNDVERMLQLYQRHGRYGATIVPKIIKKDENRVDVIYEITEGDQTFIKKINFIGNKAYKADDLKAALISKEYAWYRFFASTDTYDPERLNYDQEALRRFYLNHGYVDFKVNKAWAELTPDRQAFIVNMDLTEGERYKFAKPKIQVNLPEYQGDTSELMDLLEVEEGNWFNADRIEASISNLLDKFSNSGYAFADVQPMLNTNPTDRTVQVVFNVAEGEKVFVNRIDIRGNTRTLDKVVRRELRFKEGDAYSPARIQLSKQRVDNLGYFEKADFKVVPVSGNAAKTDVMLDVVEKSTGAFNVGIGWSSYDGMLFETGIQERNVLGTGKTAGFDVMWSQRETQYQINLSDPYFMDQNVSAGISLFHTTEDNEDYSSYKSRSTGGVLSFGWHYNDYLGQVVRYTLKRDKVTDIKEDASLYIKGQAGSYSTSMIGQELYYDKRDNKMDPTQGYYTSIGTDFAGVGGDTKFFRVNVMGIRYFPVMDDVVFSVRGDAGKIWGLGGQSVRINNRYILGDSLLRGFEYGGVGAKQGDDFLGGLWYTTASMELTFPLGLPKELGIKGKLFTDAGILGKPDDYDPNTMVYSDDVRVSVGTGIVWQSPMGTINLDFAFPIKKAKEDNRRVFRLNFGKGF